MATSDDTEGTPGAPRLNTQLGPLPEPLFLLHTGDSFGNERDDWEVEANSGRAVNELAEQQPVGATLGLYDEHTVRRLVAAERERCAALCLRPPGWLSDNQQALADEIRNSILGYAGRISRPNAKLTWRQRP